jgi:hypothetical protein
MVVTSLTTHPTTSITTTTGVTSGDTGDPMTGLTGSDTGTGGQDSTGAAEPAGTCDDPFTITDAQSHSGDTTGAADNLTAVTFDGVAPCQSGGAGEHVHAFTPSASGAVELSMTSAADMGMFVRRDCVDGATEFLCVDGEAPGTPETLSLTVIAGETYFVVVDGFNGSGEGTYTLTVSDVVGERDCSNGMDDNDDGFIDCEDPSCIDELECSASIAASCDAPLQLTPGAPQGGNTGTGSADFAALHPACSGSGGAMVEVYGYEPSEAEIVALEVGSATDQGVFVRWACEAPQTQIACVDASVGGVDELAFVTMQADQPYTVFVSAFEPGEEGPYTLAATRFPLGETEPNDDFFEADDATGGDVGRIDTELDDDWWRITVPEGADLSVTTADLMPGDCAAGRIDTELELFDLDGITSLGFNDDIDAANTNYCSEINQTGLPAGDYFVRIGSSEEYCRACRPAYTLDVQSS